MAMRLRKLSIILSISIFLSSCGGAPQTESSFDKIKITIRKLTNPGFNSIRGMSVVDSNTVWLSGANETILRSVDQGESWETITTPDADSLDFRSVHAFSKSSAIVVSAGFPARAYKTNDAGTSWSLVYENKDSLAFMNSIVFKNEREGIIIGDQINGRHLLLRTGNGGVTWQRIDSADVPKPLAVENGFAASGTCITVSKSGRFFIGLGGEQARIFSSINGYKWKAKTTPLVHGEPSSGIYSIHACGTGKIMAVGGDYTEIDSSHFPIISMNDGKSWIKAKGKVDGYRSIINYSKQGNFWVTGGTNGLEMSTDDGVNWTKFSCQDINTLRFLPQTTKAIGANGKGEIFLFDFQLED
ncbi:MAG: photosystem II stability/assembly factor-like uncharacterized protein [Vicingaceae bacterium]|jgi:photosystem II stability/assembly factor-like uncharacterized protein